MQYWYKLGRIIYRLASWLLLPVPITTKRSRGIIIADGDILLVRNWFSDQKWMLPGGGLHSKEKPNKALIREIKEELGLKITNPRYVGNLVERSGGLSHQVDIFLIKSAKQPAITKRDIEIIDYCWFPLDILPRDLSAAVRPALRLCYRNPKNGRSVYNKRT